MRQWAGLAVAAVGALTLTGCATDQAADVSAYRAISDPPGELPHHAPRAPLTLEQALRLTAARNEQLAARGEEYVQALAERQRLAAALRPTIDLFAQSRLRENTSQNSVAQTDLGVSGQYRLLTGLGDLRNVNAADARIRSRSWLVLDLRESLLLQAARAYYETMRAERLTEVFESSVRAQLARLEDARARNEAGFTRPLDVAQIEAQVSRTRAQLIAARRQAQEARATLAFLTNAELDASSLVDGYQLPDAADDQDRDTLVTVARRHRQDIVAARNEADAARFEVDAAISQFAPTISVNLDYFLLQSPDDSAAAIAGLVQLRVPVFSAGRIEAEVRAAWSAFRQRVLEYQQRVREARRDVELAHVQLQASRARVLELQTQVTVARQALALAEASYQAGLGTNLERIQAQDALLLAELEAASEAFDTKIASLALRRACGLLAADRIGAPWPQIPAEQSEPPESPFLDRPAEEPSTAGPPLPGSH